MPVMPPLMNTVRLAMAQINPVVGDFSGNSALIRAAAAKAWEAGADVLVTPELVMSGYPPEDLVLKRHFLEDCAEALDRLAAELPAELTVLVGAPIAGANGKARNAAVVLRGGRHMGTYVKQVLPNFGVFDEQRVFEPGNAPLLLRAGEALLAVHICEDGWHADRSPATQLDGLGVSAVINLSASPYHRGKHDLRRGIFHKLAARVGAPVALCNLVGGQDELVFDGGSFVIGVDGVVSARAHMFADDLLIADLPLAEVYAALVTGLRDYVDKNRFPARVVVVSGGIDSALVAALAVDALGADRVTGVTMPSQVFLHRDALRRGAGRAQSRHRDSADPHPRAVRRLPGRAVPAVARPRARRHRGKPAGPHPRQHDDGALQQVRLAGPHHRQQERDGGRLLHPVRRHGRRVRGDQGRAQDPGVRPGRWRNRSAGREIVPPAPSTARPPPSCARTRRTATRLPALRRAGRHPRALRRAGPGPR
jgi:predicted amidohydrolase